MSDQQAGVRRPNFGLGFCSMCIFTLSVVRQFCGDFSLFVFCDVSACISEHFCYGNNVVYSKNAI